MDAASFLESGLIDSTGILERVTFLESTYSIRIAEEGEVLPENLDSIERIVVFVRRKIASRDKWKDRSHEASGGDPGITLGSFSL